MSIQRRPKTGRPRTGKVRWVVRYYAPNGDEHQKSFSTKKEAQAHEQEQLRLLRRGEWVDADNAPLLEEIWPTWEAAAENPGTRRNRELIGRHLGELAGTPITKIRPTQLRKWQTQLREGRPWVPGDTGLAQNTRQNWWTQLSGCLHMALVDELILVNPCSKVPGPKVDVEPVDPKTLPTMEQVTTAINRADGSGRDTLATMMILALGTGMRPGEVCGLRWRNVDRKDRTIRIVEQSRNHVRKGENPWGPPKTRSSRRIVPVPPEVMARLLRHRLRHPLSADGPMFMTPVSKKMWDSDRFAHALGYMVGEGETWTPHSLRHLFATTMLAQGRSIKAVQRTLGHSSAATTIDVYWHVLPDETELMRDTADDFVRAICGQLSAEKGRNLQVKKGK